MKITKLQAKNFIISYQQLDSPYSGDQKQSILSHLNKVGCLQFDPLDQVGYNPCLVLQSRIIDFKGEQLHELLYKDRVLVDAWDKNMSIYQVKDWPYFQRYRHEATVRFDNGSEEVKGIIPEMKTILEEKGPCSSLNFDFNIIVDWSWSPTKASRAALESMFYQGELIVFNKIGTRRVYDFAYKYLPSEVFLCQDPNVNIEDYFKWHVKRRINAIGLMWNRLSDAWLGIHWMKTKERNAAFLSLLNENDIIEIEVEGLTHKLYMDQSQRPLLEQVLQTDEEPLEKRAAFLAPLDNMLWDRKLIKELFGFEYRWEVYKPVVVRDYGYYVLPILYGVTFIGRLEPRFDKKTSELHILNWWWEEGVEMTSFMSIALSKTLREFMNYLGAKKLVFSKASKTSKTLTQLKQQLKIK